MYSPKGGSEHSFSNSGYPFSVHPVKRIPLWESLASSSSSASALLQQIWPLYQEYGPRSVSKSLSERLNTSDALPRCDMSASPIFGSNPKIRFNAQRHAFSFVLSILSAISCRQSKCKTGLPYQWESRFFFFWIKGFLNFEFFVFFLTAYVVRHIISGTNIHQIMRSASP